MRTLLLLTLAAGCTGTFGTVEPRPVTTSSAEIAAVSRDRALEEITDARCSREFSCDNVGAGHAWRDYDTCKRDVRLSMRDVLAPTCDDGVDAYVLATCLSDIRNLHCDANENTVERYGTCANQKLCRR